MAGEVQVGAEPISASHACATASAKPGMEAFAHHGRAAQWLMISN